MAPRVSILGTRVTAAAFDEALAWLDDAISTRRATFMNASTVYSVMLAFEDPAYRAEVDRAGYVMADGMPLVWSLRLLGHQAERVNGVDFMLAFCDRFRHRRHYLFGGAPGQPDLVSAELRRRFEGIQIVGGRATPRRPVPREETLAAIEQIRGLGAEVVWTGMGTPAQDLWMAENVDRVGVPLVGVGGAFDVLAGWVRPAPMWMQRNGLQWLFRLSQEPRRMWRRYLVYNPLFIWHFSLQLLGVRVYTDEAPRQPAR